MRLQESKEPSASVSAETGCRAGMFREKESLAVAVGMTMVVRRLLMMLVLLLG